MKSSRCSDEIFGVPPQMKLNPPPLTLRSKISSRSDFIHDSGFIPTQADLVEKSTCLRKCLFLAGVARFELTNEGVKVPCLTAWRYPYKISLIILP